MTVFINNQATDLAENASVSTLLEQAGIHVTKGIAVAINSRIIQKNEWQTQTVNPNDKITIIKATQGG
ncbi:MAG: sulfur carrier protein ThiS [Bacteroidetes bacterium]|nr:sulfur carrier protein ThiS [Bacteroidota bacterium]